MKMTFKELKAKLPMATCAIVSVDFNLDDIGHKATRTYEMCDIDDVEDKFRCLNVKDFSVVMIPKNEDYFETCLQVELEF